MNKEVLKDVDDSFVFIGKFGNSFICINRVMDEKIVVCVCVVYVLRNE